MKDYIVTYRSRYNPLEGDRRKRVTASSKKQIRDAWHSIIHTDEYRIVKIEPAVDKKCYIAYGSNLDVDQMLRRCPDAIMIGSSTIDGYQLVFRGNSRSGVANIEPREGASVPVGIWSISRSDEESLDRYEGYPWLYTKQMFTLQVRGKMVKGMAYVMTLGHEIAAPMQQYLNTILEGYKDFGFDPAPLLEAAAKSRKGE